MNNILLNFPCFTELQYCEHGYPIRAGLTCTCMYLCVCKGSSHAFDKCLEDFLFGYVYMNR